MAAAIAAAVYAKRAAIATEKTVHIAEDAAEDADDALAIARANAAAAAKQVEVTQQTAASQLRAWVEMSVVEDGGLYKNRGSAMIGEGAVYLAANATLRNRGDTPAFDVTVAAELVGPQGETGGAHIEHYYLPGPADVGDGLVIAPGGERVFRVEAGGPMMSEDIVKKYKDEFRLRLKVTATYKAHDILGCRQTHQEFAVKMHRPHDHAETEVYMRDIIGDWQRVLSLRRLPKDRMT